MHNTFSISSNEGNDGLFKKGLEITTVKMKNNQRPALKIPQADKNRELKV